MPALRDLVENGACPGALRVILPRLSLCGASLQGARTCTRTGLLLLPYTADTQGLSAHSTWIQRITRSLQLCLHPLPHRPHIQSLCIASVCCSQCGETGQAGPPPLPRRASDPYSICPQLLCLSWPLASSFQPSLSRGHLGTSPQL